MGCDINIKFDTAEFSETLTVAYVKRWNYTNTSRILTRPSLAVVVDIIFYHNEIIEKHNASITLIGYFASITLIGYTLL